MRRTLLTFLALRSLGVQSAVAVLSAQGVPVFATKAGELADARKMGDTAIHDFFARVAANLPR